MTTQPTEIPFGQDYTDLVQKAQDEREEKDEILIALLDLRESGLSEPYRVKHWLDKADKLYCRVPCQS